MPLKSLQLRALLAAGAATLLLPAAHAERQHALQEVIVTAQKREQSLQQAPIAISVLNQEQLTALGVSSLDDLSSGVIPSLRVQPSFEAPSSLAIAIRGAGPSDVTPVTREAPVAVYQDGIYLARPQALSMELPDLERIEVLRGPQGTLFGRNTTGGAVSLVSRKPSGKFDLQQTIGAGNFDALTSITRINLPEFANVKTKFNYVHSERDGWVKNSAPGQEDFARSEKDGGMFSLNWTPIENLSVDYHFDKSRVLATSNYFQLYVDNGGLVGDEPHRVSHTRWPMPLEPTITHQTGHALILTWDASEALTIKSLSGYRRLEEDAFTNYDAAVYADGLIFDIDDNQNQRSQEFQFIGSHAQLDWVAGLYYFKGYAREKVASLFSLDTFGSIPGNAPNTPIVPPTNVMPATGFEVPLQTVKAHTKSQAAYGQVTWTPDILDQRLHLTAGTRYTEDDKDGSREDAVFTPYKLETDHWDSLFIVDYTWTEGFSTYVKRSTGYRSGSVNRRSITFEPYDPEEVTTWEAGLKSEFWQRRVRFNADVFKNTYDDMQFEFPSPVDATVAETANAQRTVKIQGFEMDLTATPVDGLVVGLSYTYLDSHMPTQPNPLGGESRPVYLIQTPRHAGSLTVDYTFPRTQVGTVVAHLDATSSSQSRFVSDTERADGYDLINARLTLRDIPLGHTGGTLEVAAWGKNLTDEEYAATAFQFGDPLLLIAQAFGEPRTYGVDLTYRYQ